MRDLTIAVALLVGSLSVALAADDAPVQLRVTEERGSLSYQVVNSSTYRVVNFQVDTSFQSGGYESLSCGVVAQVKAPADLVIRGVCQLPVDKATGKPVAYSSRIRRVEFANGIAWSAKE